VLAIGAGIAALTYLQRYLSEWVAAHIGYDLRNQLYDHIQHLPFTFHDHSQTGQLISRCIEDVRSIERFTGVGLVDLLRLSLLLVGIVALLLIENTRLATIALLPMIPWFGDHHFGRQNRGRSS
jgi:ATP-binding cassette subfamily B protein